MVNFFFWFFLVLFIIISLFMVLLILIQKGRGGGLSSSFGGGGGGNTAFGAKTGDVLTWVTSSAFGAFLVLAIVLNLLANNRQEEADKALVTTTAVMPAPAGSTK
jgi:preprotein translocase subunit SecG